MKIEDKVLIVRNFISKEDCEILKNWAVQSVEQNKNFVPGITFDQDGMKRTIVRLTTRISDSIEYPDLAYIIQNRIMDLFPKLKTQPIIDGPLNGGGKDGIVVSVTYNQGDVYEHVDPRVQNSSCVGLRCNILMSVPDEGGMLYVDNKPCDLNPGDLHCYLVTEYKHRVDICSGNTPRVLFMYGWQVNKEEWELGNYFA